MRAAKDAVGKNGDRYYVECGKLSSGKQPRFYLGLVKEISEDTARIRRLRVREFWHAFTKGGVLSEPLPSSERTAEMMQHRVAPPAHCWNDLALDLARELAKGATRLTYSGLPSGHLLATAIAKLNSQYEGIATFVAPQGMSGTLAGIADQHRTQTLRARRAIAPAAGEEFDENDETLHKWLNKFAAYERARLVKAGDDGRQAPTEWNAVVVKTIELIRRSVPNMPLKRFGFAEIEAMVLHFINRPPSKKSGSPVGRKYVQHCIKLIRRFIRWLPRQSDASWRRQDEWEDAFDHKVRKTDDEKRQTPIGKVKAYTVDQLQTIYQYATPFERCLFLVALNTGFGAAEISQLRRGELELNPEGDSFIKRVRLKSEDGVYGEHLLWTETVSAVEWAITRTESLGHTPLQPTDRVVRRESGKALVSPTPSGRSNKAATAWKRLTERIQAAEPDFPSLSFNKLRKTAGNLIKQFSDGETVGVFHQRTSAVKADDESERYTDRIYARVFEAQRDVHNLLRPMFESVREPFPPNNRRSQVGQRVVARIRQMWGEGLKPDEIARAIGRSRATVYRCRPGPTDVPT